MQCCVLHWARPEVFNCVLVSICPNIKWLMMNKGQAPGHLSPSVCELQCSNIRMKVGVSMFLVICSAHLRMGSSNIPPVLSVRFSTSSP
jgi:hypothetical protein